MKKALPLLLILGIILLGSAYSGAEVIVDESPVNIFGQAHYEYRDYGNYGTLNYKGGTQANSGAYFYFDCNVVPGEASLLTDIDDVINVKVKHIGTKRVYLLQRDDYYWVGTLQYGWTLKLKPQNWMYLGKWKIILNYWGSDDQQHRQIAEVQAPEVFPPRVSNITLAHSDGNFSISWSGFGNPSYNSDIDYRVVAFETGEKKFIQLFHDYTYNNARTRVTFSIPDSYGGEEYCIRLENRLGIDTHSNHNFSRALYYLVLP